MPLTFELCSAAKAGEQPVTLGDLDTDVLMWVTQSGTPGSKEDSNSRPTHPDISPSTNALRACCGTARNVGTTE
jgi:hypothetical protein